MKKMVKESLNEQDDMKRISDASYRRIYKEVKQYCQQVIDDSGETLERLYDEGADRDEDEGEMLAKHEGAIQVAQDVMEILRNL